MKRLARWSFYAAIAIVGLVTLTLGFFRWQADAREIQRAIQSRLADFSLVRRTSKVISRADFNSNSERFPV